jgi:hypothetical protein
MASGHVSQRLSTGWGGSDVEVASCLNLCTLRRAVTNIILTFDINLSTSGKVSVVSPGTPCSWCSTHIMWTILGYRTWRPCYLSRDDHDREIRRRKQRTDIGKYSLVNRTIKLCNNLPAEALGTFPCKPHIFRKRVRKLNKSEVVDVEWSVEKWSSIL